MIFKKKKKRKRKRHGGIEAIFVKQYISVCAYFICYHDRSSRGCELDMPFLKYFSLNYIYLQKKKMF